MKDLAIHQYRPPTLLLCGFLFLSTLLVWGIAISSIIDLPFSSLIALTTAALVAVFVSRFQIRLPNSTDVLPVHLLFAFWGALWFGQTGAVALGVISTILNVWPSRKGNRNFIFEGLAMTASVVLAGLVCALIVGTVTTVGHRSDGTTFEAIGLISSGCLLITALYTLLKASLLAFFYGLENYGKDKITIPTLIRKQWIDGAVIALSTMVICLPFSHFGIDFGLVVAPIAIIANIAFSIHTKRLDQKTRQISEASRIHLATVEALATAIDARDQVGLGHVQRTQIYATRLGELLGLAESDINALRTGALLHDIGKLAVPDHILNKPEKLTAAELEKTKIHSLVGASILEKIGFDYPVVPTVKYNHEFWDGSGYPEGLRGEEIPMTARILAVADAYDTLRGARPYRPAIPRDLARQIIQDEAGTHFDPTVVRCFLKNLGQLEAEIEASGLAYTGEHENGTNNFVEQIKLANREVFELYELARDFSSSLNFKETLGLFSKKIGEFVPFTTCYVFLLDETKKYASAAWVDGRTSSRLAARRIRIGEGATGRALTTKEPVRKGDARLDPSLFDAELSDEYSTMVSVPLIANEELIGAVSIYSNETADYGEEHLRLLETIARIGAEAIDKSQEHDEAKTYALTDPMTGLPNARSLQIQFEKEVARASRGGTSFQLLMLDLDGFKAVNDSFGHKVGDELLSGIGKVIREQLRDYDFLARYGGDEFVALVPDTSLEDVSDLCRRIETGVSEFRLEVEESRFASVGVSIGSASYPGSGETFDQVVIAADKAMYRRKTRRRLDPGRFMISGIGLDRDVPNIISQTEDKNGLIVELDESHVVTSTAVN